ncbi:MAG TPA: AAA family ATPase [Steroidobacteraceae bacterium]|nr:AAA family ATPase [Steroidobacteraceae bacterium]
MVSSAALQLRFDSFELDEADARLKRDGRPVALAPKAFGVLCALARQPGLLVTKNALLDAVWGHQHVSESVLKTTISQLRAALADDAGNPRYIETASRLGYRFIGKAAEGGGPSRSGGAAAGTVPSDFDGGGQAAGVGARKEVGTVPFTGRRAQLARLNEAWKKATAGQRQLVWVAGDAGVGKSTLLEEFTRASGAAAIAQGQCVEQHGSGEPYLPVLQALGDLTRVYPEFAATLRAVAPTWLVQLPWLVSEQERLAIGRELAGVSQERMVREFHELVTRFTDARPLLFVVEDLHWCDLATLRLMDHFARQRGPARVLWLATFRLTQVIAEDHPLQALRQELRLHRLADEILLDPFSEAEVQEYLRERAALVAAPEAFVRRVHAHTDGLPLFVANVVDALLGADADTSASARNRLSLAANTPLPVPEDLVGAVEARIGRLPAAVIELLEAAAVCGVEFRAGALAQVLDRPLQEIIDTCDELVKKQYWLRHTATVDLADGSLDAMYAFRHAIYRHVFHQRIGAAPRVQLHRRVAQALIAGVAQGVPVAPAELALHHERGREYAAALRAYGQAAQAALHSLAPLEARELMEHARTLLAPLPMGPERLVLELSIEGPRGVALAQIHGVGSTQSRVAFERVRELIELLPQHPARALALNGYAASLYSRGEYAKLTELSEKIDAMTQGPDSPALGVLTGLFRAGVASARGDCKLGTEWWLEAIRRCEAITDRSGFQAFIVDPETGVRSNAVRTFYERGLFDQARAQSRRAVEIAERLAQPLALSLAHWRAGMLEVRLGRPDGVLTHADRIAEVVAKTCVVQGDGPSRYLRGWALAQRGDAQQGIELIRDGLARHLAIGMIANSTEVMGYAADALLLAGDLAGAETQLGAAFAQARELDEHVYVPMLLITQSRVAQARGDAAAAEQGLRESVRVAREQGAPGFELKAALALVERPDASADDRRALAALLATFTEGADVPDVVRGRRLAG